jgi:hypothetical protein
MKVPAFLAALFLFAAPAAAAVSYVSTTGSDANDCQAPASACATMQRAVDVCPVTSPCEVILLGSGVTYTQRVDVSHRTPIVSIHGDCTDPYAVRVRAPSAGGAIFTAQDHSTLNVACLDLGSTYANNTGILSRQGAIVDFGNVVFSGMPSGLNVAAVDRGIISCVGGPVWIDGSANVHAFAVSASLINHNCPTIVAAGLTFINFASASWLSYMDLSGITVSGPGAGSGMSATKYVAQNSTILLYGKVLPGNVAGGTYDGGIVKQ